MTTVFSSTGYIEMHTVNAHCHLISFVQRPDPRGKMFSLANPPMSRHSDVPILILCFSYNLLVGVLHANPGSLPAVYALPTVGANKNSLTTNKDIRNFIQRMTSVFGGLSLFTADDKMLRETTAVWFDLYGQHPCTPKRAAHIEDELQLTPAK